MILSPVGGTQRSQRGVSSWALLCSSGGSSEVGSPQLTLELSPQRGQAGSTTLPWGSENTTTQHGTRARTITVPCEQGHQALTVIYLKK